MCFCVYIFLFFFQIAIIEDKNPVEQLSTRWTLVYEIVHIEYEIFAWNIIRLYEINSK